MTDQLKTRMKYNEALANRVREALVDYLTLEEKPMFGTLAFLIDEKLCICILPGGLLLRIDPAQYDDLLEKEGCREMQLGKRIMKGYVQVDESALQTQKEFDYWTGLALAYNKKIKPAKKKAAKKVV